MIDGVRRRGAKLPIVHNTDDFVRHYIGEAEKAWRHGSGQEVTLVFGQLTIVVRFIGSSLENVVLPVLRHAAAKNNPTTPQTIVYAVACDETGFPNPPPEWPFPIDSKAAQMRTHWNLADGPVLSSDESRGIWHLHDMSRQVGLYWVSSTAELPYWEYGSALRHHIFWGSLACNQCMLHCAVVSRGQRGALIAGPGGSGKSTLTAAAIQSGWHTTGDDFVAISNLDKPVSYRLFDVLKLTGMAETVFREISSQALNPERVAGEKALIRLSDACPQSFVESIPLDVILSAKLVHEPESRIVPTSRLNLVRALVPNTASLVRTGFEQIFSFSSELMRSLPCFEFQIGKNPIEALQVLDAFLQEQK